MSIVVQHYLSIQWISFLTAASSYAERWWVSSLNTPWQTTTSSSSGAPTSAIYGLTIGV